MSEELRLALTSPQEMDAYLEVHSGREIINHINDLVAEIERLRTAHDESRQLVMKLIRSNET